MNKNPYKSPDTNEPIPQFKMEARAWEEGYDACKFEMIDKLYEMDNALREARRALGNIHAWKVRIINGSMVDEKK